MAPVNLFSDTQTRPSEAMLRAMATAETADEQRRLDPTTNALQDRVAELLGHEAGLFLPTGTMCNGIAFHLHLRPGDEVLLDRTAHPIIAEAGGPAALSGAMIQALDGDAGRFTADQVRAALRPAGDRYTPRSRLVSVEQTTNMGGGRVWPREQVEEILGVAKDAGLRTHLDGARLLNAAVASGISAADWGGSFDTAWLDFSKGLGAPVGAVLCASRELIEEAWVLKQRWGGSMRQSGVLAAACLYALDHNVERLAEDHANARALAEGLAELPGVEIDRATVETNIVIVEVDDPAGFRAGLAERGVEASPAAGDRVRFVTHLDVDRAGIAHAVDAAREVLG